jgi:hypothetical protein
MPPQSADDDPLVLHESEALTLLAHPGTSAELCHSEPWDYGTFRLIDAASRLGASVLPRASAEGRAFLAPFLADVETAKERSTLDREAYLAFLREASRRTAEHLVTRASTGVEDRPPVVAPTQGSQRPRRSHRPGSGYQPPVGRPPRRCRPGRGPTGRRSSWRPSAAGG